jgi:predicted nucleic acid-binding protein
VIVVDASAFSAIVAGVNDPPKDWDFHVPAICDLELVSSLRRLLRSRRMRLEDAVVAVAAYLALPITRHEHPPLLGRILELRDNFTAYDAAYVTLAEELGAPLLTADRRLARAVQRHAPHVALA